MTPSQTDRFYAGNAADYAAAGGRSENLWRERLLSRLKPAAEILELGCGGGHDAQAMIAAGFRVTPTDGVPEMAREAESRLGRPVRLLRFAEIGFDAAFDGVWANACLLHVPRPELPDILARIRQALRPGGLFYASFKAGAAEGHDALGRYYNYPDEDWLRQAYGRAGWLDVTVEATEGGGYDRKPTLWLHAFAQA